MTRGRGRRQLVVVAVFAFVALGLVGLTASVFVGHDTSGVLASPNAGRHPNLPTADASDTATTLAPVSTTTATVATTVPSAATSPSGHLPPPTQPTDPPATSPPTSVTPTTTPIATTASLGVTPSPAAFPSTPPPYSPMPIVVVTITNTGAAAVNSIVVHPVGVYSVPSNTCTTLLPGQSCVADVQFCPTSPNHYLNTLTVTGQNAATGSPVSASITLDGTAT